MRPVRRNETQSGPLRNSPTRVGTRQVKKITKGRHVTLQPPDAGMACGFLGQGRLCSLSLVLKEKLIKQIKIQEERGMDLEEEENYK